MSKRPQWVTIWVVPDGASGPSRQVRVSLRQIQVALVSITAVCCLGAWLLVWSVVAGPRAAAHDAVTEENLALRARLLELDGKLDQIEREVRRLRLYEEQLHGLDPEELPGFGPVDGVAAEDEIGRTDTGLGFDDGVPGPGVELDDLGDGPELDDAELHALGDPLRRADAIDGRADDILQRIRLAEIELGHVVETIADSRARATAVPGAWPLDGVLTSGFGWRRSPFTKRWKFHFGIDLSAPVGTVIRAPAAGLVVTAEYNSGYGRMLEIDHGYEVVTRYAHNARLLVGVGEPVRQGQPIATVGMTGATTGPHLHYEIHVEGQPVDPLEHLAPQASP